LSPNPWEYWKESAKLLANSESFPKPESFDLLECGFELHSIVIVVRESQDVAVLPPGKLGR
jgi:hypothetical protein